MAEPRKVAFITLSPPDSQKRCREDEPCSPAAPMASGNNIFPGTGTAAADGEKAAERRITVRFNLRLSEPSEQASAEFNYSELVQSIQKRCWEDEPCSPAAPMASGNNIFPGTGTAADGEKAAERRITVRLNLRLSEPSEQASAEFNYSELVQSIQVKKPAVAVAPVPTNPDDPFDDDERERLQLEAMARKFESKYYDELVPASLTTKFGGFYINAGTLQFRPASDSEGDDTRGENKMKPHRKLKEGEERGMKKRKRKEEGSSMEKEKKPRKNRVPKTLG
ncbi:UNVERIFIED_CONTAM: hypothetical protein FKN15_064002 [Acipenser sinensis]